LRWLIALLISDDLSMSKKPVLAFAIQILYDFSSFGFAFIFYQLLVIFIVLPLPF